MTQGATAPVTGPVPCGGPSARGLGRYFLIFLLPVVGCARYQTFDLPMEPAHMRENYQEKNGFAVAGQVIVDPIAIEHQFGPDFQEAGYFPVLVHFENRGPGSFEIERKNFAVVLESGERFEPVPPLSVIAEVQRSPVNAGTLLLAPLVFPSILIYRNVEDYNFDMARSFYLKAFPSSLRMEEGDPPMCRAFFFRDPTGKSRSAEDFASSVLEFVVEIEGMPPAREEGRAPTPADVDAKQPKAVGRRIPFTITLAREEVP